MSNLIVARFLTGRVLKGTSLDVDPNKPSCHVRPSVGPVEEVRLMDLKALFFVRTLEGNAARDEAHKVVPTDPRLLGSSGITLLFKDGESITGRTNRYPPNRPFFFIVPVDPGSNNIRILINRAAVTSMASDPPT
ncbi:MAG: hypothetical protein ABJD11_17215 [Gemmatimonadota bacterium]